MTNSVQTLDVMVNRISENIPRQIAVQSNDSIVNYHGGGANMPKMNLRQMDRSQQNQTNLRQQQQ
ncbi:130_t:CDS:2 [Diversispora eburnea]|uniref:130_t:CDS:1 n=1 Tax=Diversispora eburnea TaxID=1213867 RepID=A0A9N8VH21_9GLOM|nr:130_t:CDS:2 [Diversispora eburnea]